ncbi:MULTISPECIES: hypothetical protein [Mycobacteriaceae]|uniref:Uncharacterized protein n=1 Tax=Mycobacterium intracellulare subsp. chimaera TaxID=222805 RepID=A0ABT7P784_MYCIT|nr:MULTISPECIES: hypothetical protein [Mycobacteriaceae]ETZ34986.1 hypothetical protein L842_0764 [Mycobacterium intracellulare MIN_052511_1280]MDM3909112.1 hypothetical protein [Mycobacterium intracellulare subsp. chimaera]MDM3929140.1 hypothetical protein [Mycobacterium intracellulare subsp. chimaera]MDM3935286.1 hypothetical protein [Mycobacterium intracellulare subsp. chimaera]MDO2360244.1 hypothetical protein [Mycobacterium avium subsp. hominissuis]
MLAPGITLAKTGPHVGRIASPYAAAAHCSGLGRTLAGALWAV